MPCWNLLLISMAVFICTGVCTEDTLPDTEHTTPLPYTTVGYVIDWFAPYFGWTDDEHQHYCGGITGLQDCTFEVYSPVCGSDGFTYDNECSLCLHRLQDNADLTIMHAGECQPDETFPN